MNSRVLYSILINDTSFFVYSYYLKTTFCIVTLANLCCIVFCFGFRLALWLMKFKKLILPNSKHRSLLIRIGKTPDSSPLSLSEYLGVSCDVDMTTWSQMQDKKQQFQFRFLLCHPCLFKQVVGFFPGKHCSLCSGCTVKQRRVWKQALFLMSKRT